MHQNYRIVSIFVSQKITEASKLSESRTAWRTVKRVPPFIWPIGDFNLRACVVFALIALVGGKFMAVLAPILQAWAVDDLIGSGLPEFALGAIGLTVAYGCARIMTNSSTGSRCAVRESWTKGPLQARA